MIVVTSVAAIGGLTFLLATMLILANRKLYVAEDPRIDQVEEMLPHSNCGACGFPGCRPFAEALVSGEALPGRCTVSNDEGRAAIAGFLGVAVGKETKVVARLGCLGLGDCERICEFDAITMDRHSLPVVDNDRCTACGDCVDVCPKDLFSLQPVTHRLWVACRNLERGDEILANCEVACTACERCAVDAPDGLVTMRDNLPVVDYSRPHAIVWIDEQQGVIKGAAARKIIRHSALPEAPT
jgi:electron transport complex protein RnfB